MKEFSWRSTALSLMAIAASVGIFLMLIDFFQNMISFTSGMRAYSNLGIIIGLGIAELAFIYLIGAHFKSCAAKQKLFRCFVSTWAVLSGTYSLVFFLRYMALVRILGYRLSIETIMTVPMRHLALFLISVIVTSFCIALRNRKSASPSPP